MAITKCINSESKQYKPVLTDKLVLDAVPTVNSLNSVTSDAVARAIAGASGEVPQVTENDNGKILTATYDALGPAVSWEDAPSGIPDMTGKDGKILGAVDNDGTMEAQWINKPESNVTTSTKQFVVGVNGTGMPITVDCANASETTSSGTVEVAGVAGRNNIMSQDGVFFAVNGIDPNNTVTITFPEDLGNASATGGFNQFVAWYQGAPGAVTNMQASLSLSPANQDGNVLKAGTYTVTGTAPSFTPDGIGLFYTGAGDAATQIVADVTAAASTLTLSTTASVVTGYSIKPSVIATPGSDAVAKVLTVTDTQGNYGWQPVPQELPPISTHAGEVLKVNSGATAVEWGTAGANYTAGDGIDISAGNEVSVKVGTGLSINQGSTASMSLIADPSQVTSSHFGYKQLGRLTAEAVAAIKNKSAVKVTPLFDYQCVNHGGAGNVFFTMAISGYDNSKAPTLSSGRIISSTNIGSYFTLVSGANYQIAANTQVTVDFSTIDTAQSTLTWSDIEANPSSYILSIISYTSDFMSYSYAKADLGTSAPQQAAATVAVTTPSNHNLEVTNPVPAYAAGDAGKVLAVNTGATGVEWVNAAGALYLNYSSISLSTRADALALAEQIQGAIDANKAVVLKYTDAYDNSFYLQLTKFNLDPTVGAENGAIQFMSGANVLTEPTGTHLYSYLWNVTITTSSFTDGRISYFYGDVSAPTPIPG